MASCVCQATLIGNKKESFLQIIMGNGPSQLGNSHEVLPAACANTLYDCFSAASRGVIKINNVSAERYEVSNGQFHSELPMCG